MPVKSSGLFIVLNYEFTASESNLAKSNTDFKGFEDKLLFSLP
jgi:hypothetical protein